MAWTGIAVHVVDFEGSLRSGVVEFGVATLRGGEVAAMATRLCAPRGRLAAEESAVHGLTDARLAGMAPFRAEWTRFADLRQDGLFAAHFSATEHALLRAEWPFPRLSPDFVEAGREVAEWGPWIDTGRLAAERAAGAGSAGLSDVVGSLGLGERLAAMAARWCPPDRARFHCAPFDALACALVLQALARDGEGRPWSLPRLLAMSTADPRLREERRQIRMF